MDLTTLSPQSWARGETWRVPLEGAACAYQASSLSKALLVVPHSSMADRLRSDLEILGCKAAVLPESKFENDNDDVKPMLRRGAMWKQWKSSEQGFLIATPGSLVLPMRAVHHTMTLSVGEKVGRDRLIQWLGSQGYRAGSIVWAPGDFAVRGAVVDLFDPTGRWPLRVEFFDEEVESLRDFHPQSQRSIQRHQLVTLASALSPQGSLRCVLDDFEDSTKVLLYCPQKLENAYRTFVSLWNRLHGDQFDEQGWDQLLEQLGSHPRLRLDQTGNDSGVIQVPFFKGDLKEAQRWIKTQQALGVTVHVTTNTLTRPEILGDLLQVTKGVTLSGGFVDFQEKIAYLSDQELFGLTAHCDQVDRTPPAQLSERLSEGDWVTHERYGLCRFEGMGEEKFGNATIETLILGFAEGKKLIIPMADLERLTPWDGDGEPTADRLGSKKWSNAKAKAQEQIEKEAQDLLEIHARRALTAGRAFAEPGEYSRLFEASFPYRETRDQLQAIAEIQQDMSRPYPMDRLLVGDVGHGKTEVALRAAVRALENGTQVAFVVPTTVLANQHYHTARARMAELPFHLAQLSRMVPAGQQKKIKSGLANGTVDFVVGTHSLFKDGVEFSSLGLLIIDEEHRFGVAHKESLKKKYPGVDVLSLSATPIPRTLSLGLRGIKDISRITTPPASRGQVFTVTGPWEELLVRDAIEREFARGGQVYYLHNRVEDIDQLAFKLQKDFPEHRIATAHGQMSQRILEKVMEDFAAGAVDLLVCTTLVESGLDVGSANTLIVDDARMLGLAQMHQIRGRVGRREQNGFAYFLYPGNLESLSAASRERIEALGVDESENGGYRLAMKDLEIRGAGEILGSNQTGFKNRVGYGLYYRMLRAKIAELRGETPQQVEVRLTWSPRIPVEYLPDNGERLGLYRHLAKGLSFQEADDLREQLNDRCGKLPRDLDGAIALAVIRREGHGSGIVALTSSLSSTDLVFERPKKPVAGFISNGNRWVGVGESAGLLVIEKWVRERREADERL